MIIQHGPILMRQPSIISSSSIEAWLSNIAAANTTSTAITSNTNATFAAYDCQFVIGRALNKKHARTDDQTTPVKRVKRTSLDDEQVLSTKPQERLRAPLAFMDPNERTVRRSARTPSTSKKKRQGLDAILQEQDQQEAVHKEQDNQRLLRAHIRSEKYNVRRDMQRN
ncbi:hypothetical protein H2203_005245 [Taxawa tesnikishii (nom. ined.)]|nr:hypothetical protein H2203_005245 [Dothideales sp. JES 119]